MAGRQVDARSALGLGLALILALVVAGSAHGQELAVTGGFGQSDFPELDRPVTVALHGQLPLEPLGALRLVVGARVARDAGREPGTTCDQYWPIYAGCVEEPIEHDSRLVQLELGIAAGVPVGLGLELRAALLGVRSTLDAGSEGVETGRPAGNYYPEGDHRGWAVQGEVAWHGLSDRLGLLARARRQRLDFGGCVTDTAVPFCGKEAVTVYEVGLTYHPFP